MRVIIAGSRHIKDRQTVYSAILRSGFTGNLREVVSGGAGGVDALGEEWARLHGIPVKNFYPDWGKGKIAGRLRNREMAHYADALILVWDGKSRGSESMLQEAKHEGLLIYNCIVRSGEDVEQQVAVR